MATNVPANKLAVRLIRTVSMASEVFKDVSRQGSRAVASNLFLRSIGPLLQMACGMGLKVSDWVLTHAFAQLVVTPARAIPP